MQEQYELKYSKQATKYYLKTTGKTRKRIDKMLENLKALDGDIEYIRQHEYYRIKIEHYRAIFTIDETENIIEIHAIGTKNDMRY